jgi:hypothetical protein
VSEPAPTWPRLQVFATGLAGRLAGDRRFPSLDADDHQGQRIAAPGARVLLVSMRKENLAPRPSTVGRLRLTAPLRELRGAPAASGATPRIFQFGRPMLDTRDARNSAALRELRKPRRLTRDAWLSSRAVTPSARWWCAAAPIGGAFLARSPRRLDGSGAPRLRGRGCPGYGHGGRLLTADVP